MSAALPKMVKRETTKSYTICLDKPIYNKKHWFAGEPVLANYGGKQPTNITPTKIDYQHLEPLHFFFG